LISTSSTAAARRARNEKGPGSAIRALSSRIRVPGFVQSRRSGSSTGSGAGRVRDSTLARSVFVSVGAVRARPGPPLSAMIMAF
jgi:hypothetical protein